MNERGDGTDHRSRSNMLYPDTTAGHVPEPQIPIELQWKLFVLETCPSGGVKPLRRAPFRTSRHHPWKSPRATSLR
jgi:hypothetical protein